MNALKHRWCETSLLSQAVLKHFVPKDLIFKRSVQGPVLYPAKTEGIYDIVSYQNFHGMLATLLLQRKLQHVGHKWVISALFCGSVGQMC